MIPEKLFSVGRQNGDGKIKSDALNVLWDAAHVQARHKLHNNGVWREEALKQNRNIRVPLQGLRSKVTAGMCNYSPAALSSEMEGEVCRMERSERA